MVFAVLLCALITHVVGEHVCTELDDSLRMMPAQLYDVPRGYPASLTTEAHIGQHEPYIAPILYGGLGNVCWLFLL